MDDEFEAEEEHESCTTPAFQVGPIDWLLVGVGLARQVSGAVHEALSSAEMLLVGQANFWVSQKSFQDEARREIETLTQED